MKILFTPLALAGVGAALLVGCGGGTTAAVVPLASNTNTSSMNASGATTELTIAQTRDAWNAVGDRFIPASDKMICKLTADANSNDLNSFKNDMGTLAHMERDVVTAVEQMHYPASMTTHMKAYIGAVSSMMVATDDMANASSMMAMSNALHTELTPASSAATGAGNVVRADLGMPPSAANHTQC